MEAIPVYVVDQEKRSQEAVLVRRAQAGRPWPSSSCTDNVGRVYASASDLRDAEWAEELAQDVFVRAWQKLIVWGGLSWPIPSRSTGLAALAAPPHVEGDTPTT